MGREGMGAGGRRGKGVGWGGRREEGIGGGRIKVGEEGEMEVGKGVEREGVVVRRVKGAAGETGK